MVKIDISEKAKDDIRNILEYIKVNLENSKAASDLADEISKEINFLKENPFLGPEVTSSFLSNCGFRFKTIKNSCAYYIVSESGDDVIIHIVRFLYSKRDYESILSREDD